MSLTIGITDCDKWTNYQRWFKTFDPSFVVVRLKKGVISPEQAKQCDGIVLSGGEDVHPSYYNKPGYIEQFGLKDFNKERDEYELAIIDIADRNSIPLLGICRGLQIANVFYKGTLIPDLPSINKQGHAEGKKDTEHAVELASDSLMYKIVGESKGIINSHHHQAADIIGEGLKAVAFSDNGVVEGIEKDGESFFQLVQWHPERMDVSNPFSGKLREAFVKACKKQFITV